MTLPRKILAVTVSCALILGFWALAKREGSSQERPISVLLEASPCKINGSEKIKIALNTAVDGSDLSYGRVVLKIWQLDQMTATWLVHFDPIEGHTDRHGRFISQWHPPGQGNYLVCARVSKSGCTCGQAVSKFTVSN